MQIAAGDADLGFICGSFGAAEDGAAAIFGEAFGMMRSRAARTIEALAFARTDFRAAIWADRIHLRCRSW